jgi:hypothetical protein
MSPPVNRLMRDSAQRRPSSVSVAVTRRAAEARQVGRMAIAVARCECLNWRSAVIIAQDARDGRQQDRLAIRAHAMSEEKHVLASKPGQGVAERAAQVGDQRGVSGGNAIEESEEARAIAARADVGDLGHVIVGAMLADPTRLEVDDAVGRVQEQRVGVPLIDRRGELTIGLREPLDGRDRFRARDRDGVLVIAAGRHLAANSARPIEGLQRIVSTPMRARPRKPSPLCSDVSQVSGMHQGEAEGERLI